MTRVQMLLVNFKIFTLKKLSKRLIDKFTPLSGQLYTVENVNYKNSSK